MATGPGALALKAAVEELGASAGVRGAFYGDAPRIYDEVPANPVFPYIVANEIELNDDGNCGDAWRATLTTHVYSRPSSALKPRTSQRYGKQEAQAIVDAMISALGGATLSISGFEHVTSESETNFRSSRIFTEPDGKTHHAVVVFEFDIDQAAEG